MSLKNALALSVLTLAFPAAWAADYSADSLSLHPSCVLYQGEDGVRALVNGAVVFNDGRPEMGARQRFHLDGQTFTAITDDAGLYTADVPVSSLNHQRMKEGRSWDRHGRLIGGQAGLTDCIAPKVHVGALEPVP